MTSSDDTQSDSLQTLLGKGFSRKKGHKGETYSGIGSVLSFHDITYSVRVREKGCACFAKYKTKEILREISGIMKPGMNAILGPTGSGKTSLLDLLAGRKETGTIFGDVLLDGFTLPKDFKCMSGYVVQDDIVMGTLTVRENLNFSAALRLPRTTTSRQRDARVEAILFDLGLTQVADSKVGTEFIRGISGGERKRTNIGMELIISPSVLFLDEPTTGLDAFTAVSVMTLLSNLSKRGNTIIFSIHQPRYAIVKLFDSLTLLGNGQIVYHGPAAETLTYFDQLGYVCEQYDNPGDFVLDTIQSVTVAEEGNDNLSLAVKYQSSQYAQTTQTELDAITDCHQINMKRANPASRQGAGYPTSRLFQFCVISKRTALNIIRTPSTSIMQVLINIIFGLFVGGIYYQTGDNEIDGLQNRVGALFFIVMNMIFANMAAVELFIKQRAIFMHESISGYYRVSSYFIAKIVCDMLPLRMIPVLTFSSIAYFMIGFRTNIYKFLKFILVLLLTSLAGSALAFLYSALVSIQALATLFLALTFVLMMVFGGLLVNLKTLPVALRWLKYLSIFHYAMEALEINELDGMLFCNKQYKVNGTCIYPHPNVTSGTLYLESQGFYPPDKMWFSTLALGCFVVGLLVLTYLRLRFMRKTR